MDSETALGRAHALSAQASTLLKGAPSLEDQDAAAKASDAAADLFEQARGLANDVGAAMTLELLASQNRKQARLIERKVSAGRRALASRQPAGEDQGPALGSSGPASGGGGRRDAGRGSAGSSTGQTGASSERRRRKAPSPAARHRTSIPPFATQPPLASTPTVHSINASTLAGSSSSSEKFDDSFVVFGSAIDTSDPFARFWNVLETALHDITNPVAFASAPLQPASRRSEGAGRDSHAGKVKGKGKEREEPVRGRKESQDSVASEADSFYLVTKEGDKQSAPGGRLKPEAQAVPKDAIPTVPKTPEELALENSSLRGSLDAISKHAHALELEVRKLREREERKGEMMKSVVMGVRREAQKAIQSQEIYRSQLLQASMVRGGPASSRPGSLSRTSRQEHDRPSIATVLDGATQHSEPPSSDAARIAQLEDQVKSLQLENEKQRAHLQKYRDRFEKLKSSARSKREAKLHAATPLDVVGEENAGEA